MGTDRPVQCDTGGSVQFTVEMVIYLYCISVNPWSSYLDIQGVVLSFILLVWMVLHQL